MAKGCGNNSVEFWYYGKGNITEVGIPITYNAGTASQGGSTTIIFLIKSRILLRWTP